MKHALAIIAVLALLAPVRADEFHLTDAAGKKHGPFEFKQGETLSIAGQEYTISRVQTKEQKIIEKMKTIIIPEMDFRHANIRDVIAFLRHAGVEFDKQSERHHRGVNFVLGLPRPQHAIRATADPFEEILKAQPLETEVPLITFPVRDVSLHDAINIICKVGGLQWSIQDSVVMIEKKKESEKVQQPPPQVQK